MAEPNVEIILAADGVEADVEAYDKSGKKIDLPHRIVITPYFFRKDAVVNTAYCRVLADEAEVSKAILQLSGSSGSLKTTQMGERQEPKFLDKLETVEEYEEEEYEEEDDGEADDASEDGEG